MWYNHCCHYFNQNATDVCANRQHTGYSVRSSRALLFHSTACSLAMYHMLFAHSCTALCALYGCAPHIMPIDYNSLWSLWLWIVRYLWPFAILLQISYGGRLMRMCMWSFLAYPFPLRHHLHLFYGFRVFRHEIFFTQRKGINQHIATTADPW